MYKYPQTIMQLYSLLKANGYTREDLEAVAVAYTMGQHLLGAHYRCSGNPFLAHLVGTAGILVHQQASRPEIVAGLLHAVYEQGLLSLLVVPSLQRQVVRQQVGSEAEELIHRYQTLMLTSPCVENWLSGQQDPTALDRQVLRIRVANELEDSLDLAPLYCATVRCTLTFNLLDQAIKVATHYEWLDLAADLKLNRQHLTLAQDPCLTGAHSRYYTLGWRRNPEIVARKIRNLSWRDSSGQ